MNNLKMLASASTMVIAMALSAAAHADGAAIGQGNAQGDSNATTSGNTTASDNSISATTAIRPLRRRALRRIVEILHLLLSLLITATTRAKIPRANTSLVKHLVREKLNSTSLSNTSNKTVTANSNNSLSADNGNSSTKTSNSNNTVTADNGNTSTKTVTADSNNTTNADVGNNQSKNTTTNTSLSNTSNKDVGNNQSKNTTTTVTADNGNSYSNTSNKDTGNNQSTNLSIGNITVTATVSNEDLSGSVTGITTSLTGHGGGSATTGGITGSTYSGFAGIVTASNNTGIGSINQAATSIAANANVTFGTP